MPRERLHKILAAAGFGSRRTCEELILAGRVAVNGETVEGLPAFADLDHDKVQVDGVRVKPQQKVYVLLNKPPGVMCTSKDTHGRTTVLDLIEGCPVRLYPVGRLDKDSQGLLLLTNDGELTKRLTHPRYGVEKVYIAQVPGEISGAHLEQLRKGVWLAEGKARAQKVRILKRSPRVSLLEVTLTEGKNRQVRRMLAKLGFKTRRLTRVRFGPLVLGGVKAGHYRPLTASELADLRKMVKPG